MARMERVWSATAPFRPESSAFQRDLHWESAQLHLISHCVCYLGVLEVEFVCDQKQIVVLPPYARSVPASALHLLP